MSAIFWLIDTVLTIALWIVIAHVVMSWLLQFGVIDGRNHFVRQIWHGVHSLTEPMYRPIRRVLPNMGGLDLAPLVVCIAILFLQRLIMIDLRVALLT